MARAALRRESEREASFLSLLSPRHLHGVLYEFENYRANLNSPSSFAPFFPLPGARAACVFLIWRHGIRKRLKSAVNNRKWAVELNFGPRGAALWPRAAERALPNNGPLKRHKHRYGRRSKDVKRYELVSYNCCAPADNVISHRNTASLWLEHTRCWGFALSVLHKPEREKKEPRALPHSSFCLTL